MQGTNQKTEPPKRLRFFVAYLIVMMRSIICVTPSYPLAYVRLESYYQFAPQGLGFFAVHVSATLEVPILNAGNHVLRYSVFSNCIPAFETAVKAGFTINGMGQITLTPAGA